MPLQTSGEISFTNIAAELAITSTNSSLRSMSSAAGFNSPDAMSEFYGFSTFPVQYLVIAGGGAGGINFGGGGGAGGYRSNIPGENTGGGGSAESSLNLIKNQIYSVIIGAASGASANGNNSQFASIIATGGGKGGNDGANGNTGGSGGAGGLPSDTGTIAGGNAVTNPVQGYKGGDTIRVSNSRLGTAGGGGAGQLGFNNGATYNGGNGGAGIQSNITGTPVFRAGGGGGMAWDSAGGVQGAGGSGGGGAGGTVTNDTPAAPGSPNTGGGGGGNSSGTSALGGSGIIIIKIPDSITATFTVGVSQTLFATSGGFKTIIITGTSNTNQTAQFS